MALYPSGNPIIDMTYQTMAQSIQSYVALGKDPALWITYQDPMSAYYYVAQDVQANYLTALIEGNMAPFSNGPGAGGEAHDDYSPWAAMIPSNESALFLAGAALVAVFLLMRGR